MFYAPLGRLTRRRLRLVEYTSQIAYKKGIINQQKDAHSRLKTLPETVVGDLENNPAFLLTHIESHSEFDCEHYE